MTVHRVSSPEVVGSIDNLLLELFLRLPVKSLVRLKLVCKRWKSLITSRGFSLQYSRAPSPAVGLFYRGPRSSEFNYIPLNVENRTTPPFIKLNFPEDPYPFWIHQSCNGLLLCCSSGKFDRDRAYADKRSPIRLCYVFNPTTNCFIKLPRPGVVKEVPRLILGVTLAFDPAKSTPCKVVCVRGSEFAPDLCQIELYSTRSSEWSLSGNPFRAKVDFRNGVYWNGFVLWINYEDYEVLFFNVDQERLGNISMPDLQEGHGVRKICHLGESCDHLHLITGYDAGVKLIVYEMMRDCLEWFIKYCVDLTPIVAIFPGMIFSGTFRGVASYAVTIYFLVRGEKETALLVMKILNKVVPFNLECNTFEEIHEFGANVVGCPSHAFEYIESLRML